MWKNVLIEAFACSLMLFIAHEIPVNTKIIEPKMAGGQKNAYIAGLLYYTIFLIIPIYLCHKIF